MALFSNSRDLGMGGCIRCQIRYKNGRLHRIHYSMLERLPALVRAVEPVPSVSMPL